MNQQQRHHSPTRPAQIAPLALTPAQLGGPTMRTSDWAAALCDHYLKPLGNRWIHSTAVAKRCDTLAQVITTDSGERDQLIAAGYVHDIGYAPELAATQFHPLDGARFLNTQGHPRLARLVAHHTGAKYEAELRSLTNDLAAFTEERSDLAAALTYADLTTGPAGQSMTPAQRRGDIATRYGPSAVVTRAIELAWPHLTRLAAEFESRTHGVLNRPTDGTWQRARRNVYSENALPAAPGVSPKQ